jgi:aminoglycoside phosphotransferase family enzyme/predicted kinase
MPPSRSKATTSATSLRAWLADPASHEDGTQHVEVRETHISWVYLTRHFAYKLKKPVHFDFLDFRQPESRFQACTDEVRLNSRLAPDVYLGVIAVGQTPERQFTMDGTGEVVDWLVKMRRLDDSRRLDMLLSHNGPAREQLSEVGNLLAHFYRNAPAVTVSPADYVARLADHVLANRRALLDGMSEAIHSTIKRVHADQLLFLRLFGDYFHDRICEGRVVDGHGDIRPEHVYLYTPPKIVDCIEFSQDFRTVDIADDLSFFAMECAAVGRSEVGLQVLRECLTAIGDTPKHELVDFFMGYRACVRAKVALQGSAPSAIHQTGGVDRALHYMHLAESHAPLSGPPWLVVVCGGAGSGKTTLSRQLAETLGFEHLATDTVRREVYGRGGAGAEVDQGLYSPVHRLAVYREVYQRATRLLDENVSVILDGSFQLTDAWKELEQVLPHTSARVLGVYCRCAPDLARHRVEARLALGTSDSDARPEMVRKTIGAPIEIPDNIPRVCVDTANAPAVLAECVYRRMRAMLQTG